MKNCLVVLLSVTIIYTLSAQTASPQSAGVKKQTQVAADTTRVSEAAPKAGLDTSHSSTAGNVPSVSADKVEVEETKELVSEDTAVQVPDSVLASLKIVTVPESATVVFDGNALGKTPFTIADIAAGKHVLLLKKKGYFAKKATVNINAGSQNELTFELLKPVVITITSEPVGAAIIMNDVKAGTTPYADSTLKPDTYNIALGLEGFQKEQHTVTLGSGERDSMHIILKPIEKQPEKKAATRQDEESGKKDRKVASVLDKVALAVFIGFSLIILLIELTQGK